MRHSRINETRLAELCAKGLNPIQIAARLRVGTNTVYAAVKRLNLSVAAAPQGKTGISFASRA